MMATNYGLNIRDSAAMDIVCLGALVHRLDPGVIPFRKANRCQIHGSGGEFNVAANLSDCFGLRTGIVTAIVKYPVGDLVAERVRAMGVYEDFVLTPDRLFREGAGVELGLRGHFWPGNAKPLLQILFIPSG